MSFFPLNRDDVLSMVNTCSVGKRGNIPVPYLFNGVLDNIPRDRDSAGLPHADGPSDGLLFHRRVPLGLDNVDVIRRR